MQWCGRAAHVGHVANGAQVACGGTACVCFEFMMQYACEVCRIRQDVGSSTSTGLVASKG